MQRFAVIVFLFGLAVIAGGAILTDHYRHPPRCHQIEGNCP